MGLGLGKLRLGLGSVVDPGLMNPDSDTDPDQTFQVDPDPGF